MTIDGTKKLGDWGKLTPVNNEQHVTQTNSNSHDGEAFHITQDIPGSGSKVHDRFDSNGNFINSDFAKKK